MVTMITELVLKRYKLLSLNVNINHLAGFFPTIL